MFETASAQSIGLFQSPSLTAVERMLTSLSGRISGLDRFFLNRQESFVERVFSRHFDAIGIPEWRQAPVARTVPPAEWKAPSGWVSAPREVRPAGGAPARGIVAAPATPAAQPTTRGPAIPQRPAAVAPAALPVVSPDTGPAVAANRPAVTPAAPTRPGAAAVLPSETSRQPATASVSAAVSSSRTASSVADPQALAEPSPHAVAALRPVPSDATAAPVADMASSGPAVVAEPVAASDAVSLSLPTPTALPALDVSSQAPVTSPIEPRVRDLLPRAQTGSPVAAVASALAPTPAIAPPAPRAKSFQHLSWADTQLSRSPWWRAATLPSLGSAAAPTPAQPSMPMLQTPELAPPTRSRTEPAAQARPSVSPAAPLAPVATVAKPGVSSTLQTPAAAPSVVAGAPVSTSPAAREELAARLTPQATLDASASTAVRSSASPSTSPSPVAAVVSQVTARADSAAAADLPAGPAPDLAARIDAAIPSLHTGAPAAAGPTFAAPALSAVQREGLSAAVTRTVAPTVSAQQLLRLDPGLVPQRATPELARILAGGAMSSSAAAPIPWAQPGGLWSQPAWSPSGILARMADGPLNTQLAAWHSAPGVASRVRQYVAQASTVAGSPSPVPALSRPWVAPDAGPMVATERRSDVSLATSRTLPVAMPTRPQALVPPVGPATVAPAPIGVSAASSAPVAQRSAAGPSVQPWRDAGGVAALAELFAAGVGLGSGLVASSAQVEEGAARPSLVADWLQPLILRSAPASTGLADRRAPLQLSTGLAGVVGTAGAAPSALGSDPRGYAASTVPSLASLPFVPVAGSGERLSPRRVSAPVPMAATSAQAASPTLSTLAPRVPSTAASAQQLRPDLTPASAGSSDFAPTLSGAGSLFPALPVGGLGLLAQRFAGDQSQRTISGGLPFVAQAATWAAAPGLPATLQRGLRQALSPTETSTRSPSQAVGLPYLSLLPRVAPGVEDRAMIAAAPAVSAQPTAVPRPRVTAPASSSAAAVSSPAPMSAAAEVAAPWFAPGGAGTLAELFATGIATTSGAAAWLTQLHAQAPQGVVPSWIGQWLASQRAATVADSAVSAPAAPSAVTSLPYLRATPPSAPLPISGAVPARRETGVAAPSAGDPAVRQVAPRLGLASVRAERFAAQQGLVAAPAGPGQWAPVAGGLVWLPTPAAATNSAAAVGAATPASGPSAAVGGLGLRSELFVRREQARVLQPGERMLSTLGISATSSEPAPTTEAVPSTTGRWARSGQLMYLPASTPSPSVAATGTARTGSQGVHVSPLALARPWSALPAELRRLGLPSLGGQQGPALPSLVPPRMPAAASPPLPRAAVVPGAAPWSASRMPVLAADSLRSDPEVRLVRNPPAPRVVASQRPYELAARFASPMLTAFPPAERNGQVAAQSEPAKPQMLWPQTGAVSRERIERVLAMLPPSLPSSGPLAALAELTKSAGPNPGTGMPLWQRLPASLPMGLPAVTAPIGQEPEKHAEHAAAEHEHASSSPELTLIQGDSPSRLRRSSEPVTRPAAAKPANTPPPVEIFKAALAASGASREHVEASAKLMQVIQGQASGQALRGDDRLSLDDLTLVAISMGQGRMAAATNAGASNIPSIEAAIGLPASMHPTVAQDDREARRKIDQMAQDVLRKLKELKNNQGIRDGFDL